jgi:catechol 2,3-dioxygenase-like lactoylglutathione lyase family enzyme
MHRIGGIQQVGVGVANACEAYAWYKKHFGFESIIFEDKAPASLMTRYTGGKVHSRYAVLAMNMQGGAGLEIWQYTSREAIAPHEPHHLGDTGIFAVKIRCKDVEKAYGQFSRQKLNLLTSVYRNPFGQLHFYLSDPYKNIFDITEDNYWFSNNDYVTGGVCGAMIGVSDLSASISFYQHVLSYSVVTMKEEIFPDFEGLNGSSKKAGRVLLKHNGLSGPFSRLLGPSFIELIQINERASRKIYRDRYWGDLGFIHICYDICGMKHHASLCQAAGYSLTVNSESSFEMGKASGHFAYNEDPDGALIEYVETHKVPILKKLNWYLDLRKRNTTKPLPDWMIHCMGVGKKKLQLSS